MHSRMIHASPDGPTRFHHNPDLSGDVIINVPAAAVEASPGDAGVMRVRVPGGNLEGFILEVLRDRMVARLEEMPLGELRTFLFPR
jgi:hypothetical protein